MDINKYTQKSQEAILKAQDLAVEHHHYIKTLTLCLLLQKDGIIPSLIERSGANTNQVKLCGIVSRIPCSRL